MTCTDANGIGPLLGKPDCDKMEAGIPHCLELYQQCQVSHDHKECTAALEFCNPVTQCAYSKTKRSFYDVRERCAAKGPCDDYSVRPLHFLNDPRVRAALGAANRSIVPSWQTCNDTVNGAFWNNLDSFYPSAPYIGRLLDRGIRFLIYHGIYDMSCNYIGGELAISNINWHGKRGFNTAANRPKKWSGGTYWEFGDFRYSRIDGAGHVSVSS